MIRVGLQYFRGNGASLSKGTTAQENSPARVESASTSITPEGTNVTKEVIDDIVRNSRVGSTVTIEATDGRVWNYTLQRKYYPMLGKSVEAWVGQPGNPWSNDIANDARSLDTFPFRRGKIRFKR